MQEAKTLHPFGDQKRELLMPNSYVWSLDKQRCLGQTVIGRFRTLSLCKETLERLIL